MAKNQLSSRQIVALINHLGPGWVARRVVYQIKRRSGALRRRMPLGEWTEVPVARIRLVGGQKPTVILIGPECVPEADAMLRGDFRLFSDRVASAGYPPDWQANYLDRGRSQASGRAGSAARHWSEFNDASGGDIKGVWELSRFGWAFTLARAHARTGEPQYAEGFWRLFEDWCRHNPPNAGPNWMCGQEAAFRLFAVVFAAEVLGVPAAQQELLARFVHATARRIEATIGYALSQQNNHGVSECVGLLTAALLLPESREAARWRARAWTALQTQLAELVYADGGFAQHSLIYHRVLLDDLCWLCSRLQAHAVSIPDWLLKAGERALRFLAVLVDPATGRAPLYGANDGARVLPLSESDFLDFRPTVQAAAAWFFGRTVLPPGPWDEAAAWLHRDLSRLPAASWPALPAAWHAPQSGCALLTQGDARLFFRCPTRFVHRPSQADMLHVDVWHRGEPVALDGGSFSYNSDERFTQLGTAAHHNVLVIDEAEPMRKFSRFLYLPWPEGKVETTPGGYTAMHDGYAKLGVCWTRTVLLGTSGGFTVRDHVSGVKGRRLRWHWRLADRPWRLCDNGVETRETNRGFALRWHGADVRRVRLVRSAPDSAWGWWSPHYGAVEPACALLLECDGADQLEFSMEFSPLS